MKKNEVIETLSKAYFSEECHEKELLDLLPKFLINVKIFVDIGASLGQYTYHANKHLQGGHIYAIEADPMRYEELEKNCKKWEADSTNKIISMHAAASDNDGKTTFFVTNSDISGGLFTRSVPDRSLDWYEESVNCIKLDTLFNEKVPDFVKIDVEGAELAVLKGAVNILKQGRTRFLIEVHSFSGQVNPDKVLAFMKSFGYYGKTHFGRILFEKLESDSLLFKLTKKIFGR